MAYTDKSYFLKRIRLSELDRMTYDDSETPQDEYLEDAIATADNMIDGYLRNVTDTLPLATPPEMIKQCSYYIASYYLHDRIQYADIPERVKDNYDAALNLLKDIAAGKATLPGLPEPDEDSSSSNTVDYNVNEANFGKDTF